MSNYETNPVGALQVKFLWWWWWWWSWSWKCWWWSSSLRSSWSFQERFQSRGITPQYRVVQAEGASHAPTFSFQVTVIKIILAIISWWALIIIMISNNNCCYNPIIMIIQSRWSLEIWRPLEVEAARSKRSMQLQGDLIITNDHEWPWWSWWWSSSLSSS